VTADTLHIMVLPEQRKFCLPVMIEKELLPASFKVATFTFAAKASLVLVILAMARVAICFQFFLVQIPLVAADTLHLMVFPEQGIFGSLVMIEQDLLPASIGVAGLAFEPKAALVFIVLLVAPAALQRRFFEFVIDMATFAFNIHMFTQQRKVRFAVVEMGCLPVLFLMAIRTLFTQAAFVLVDFFMATDAFGWRFPVFFLRKMAVLAKDLFFQMPAFQDKSCNCVVEIHCIQFGNSRVPASVLGMALLALLFLFHQAVVAPFIVYILLDLLVTVFAQP